MKNIMKEAHNLTKKIIRKGDSYRATFRICLCFAHSKIKKEVDKMLKKSDILNFKESDTTKVFESEIGEIRFVDGKTPVCSGWYVFKQEGYVIAKSINTIKQELKGKTPKYPNCLYTKEYNDKKEVKRMKRSEEYYSSRKCWECGCKLDRNGNCEVCGCSKEISQF